MSETFESAMLTETPESSENSSISTIVHKTEAKPYKIVGRHDIYSVAFLVDGKHIVSGGKEGKIQRWRAEDGTLKEVETPMDARSMINDMAVSLDGKQIVCGTDSGEVTVWDAESHKQAVTRWQAHSGAVGAVDISPDETRVATGSSDKTACVWSLSTGQRLLGPLEHGDTAIAAKFSPDGRLIATATWQDSVQVYESLSGRLLVDVPIEVDSHHNQSLVWVSNSKNLFVLSFTGKINYLDASTGTTLSSWPIHSGSPTRCIALASNGTFIAASASSSVSFWDTTTHKQIGSIIKHSHQVVSMAISANYDLVIGGFKGITLWNIHDVLPSSHLKGVSALA